MRRWEERLEAGLLEDLGRLTVRLMHSERTAREARQLALDALDLAGDLAERLQLLETRPLVPLTPELARLIVRAAERGRGCQP